MLEAAGDVSNRPRELRLDAESPAARRSGVVRLVQDEQAAAPSLAQPRAHRVRVGWVREQPVGHEEEAVRRPGIHSEAPLLPHADQVQPVQNHEPEAKPLLELRLPLAKHGRRGRDDNGVHFLAEQQLACDQPCLDGLSQARVVGNEQVDQRKPERLAQGLDLVGLQLDSGPERCLHEAWIGRRDAIPPQRVQKRPEPMRLIEPLAAPREFLPALLAQDAAVSLVVPVDLERFALCIVLGAGEAHQRRCARASRFDRLDEPASGPHVHELALLRNC